jgi:hypothetical protein
MKYLFIYMIAIFSLIGCSCTKDKPMSPLGKPLDLPSASVSATAVIPPAPYLVSVENFKVVLPSNDWTILNSDTPGVRFLGKNLKLNNLVVLIKEKYTGTYDDYALLNFRGLKDQGATLVSSDQAEFGGAEWVFISSTKDDVSLLQWVTYKDGFGYALSCGGSGSPEAQVQLCQQIAGTLQLN